MRAVGELLHRVDVLGVVLQQDGHLEGGRLRHTEPPSQREHAPAGVRVGVREWDLTIDTFGKYNAPLLSRHTLLAHTHTHTHTHARVEVRSLALNCHRADWP